MASILMVIEAKIATTYLVEQIMRACGLHGVDYEVKFLNELRIDDVTPNTIPMFVRCGDPLVLSWAQLLVDANRSYIYYIDDNFWRIRGESPLAVYYRHPLIRKALQFAVSHAETVIVNSPELATFVSRFNTRVAILPAFFDFSLIEGVAQSASEEIRIGFAGSPSRIDDLDLIAPLIEPVLERFPKTIFEFAGVLPRGIAAGTRVRFFPHTGDYATYIRFQASRNWAIGLAPLLDHEANRGKTDNKYREYGACRIAGIYSNIPPYRNVVIDNETGLLIENTKELWLNAIENLISSPGTRKNIGNSAFNHVDEIYNLQKVALEWARLFQSIDMSRQKFTKQLGRGGFGWRKTLRKLQRYAIYIHISYIEGGIYLVARRIAKKLLVIA
ncbi:glycosyltransferase family 1 protein [Mesorhizobium sp. ESP-6-4]|uniref:glycosyltransferase family 1 protein n=1 Tax=Mesorhizobium sp. ESP-6-4 TaxID=2876624 RepID=UPI001CC93914|nr:glycosyltransferase family 1 protein [Mesorhizobium sp. ESP-6-4]MBZ9662162.1 glycosyltransferase family 1 protein [Mesorhizobium sp. ESP-6-4]